MVSLWTNISQKSKTDKAGKIAELLDREIEDRPINIMVSQNMNRSHAESNTYASLSKLHTYDQVQTPDTAIVRDNESAIVSLFATPMTPGHK